MPSIVPLGTTISIDSVLCWWIWKCLPMSLDVTWGISLRVGHFHLRFGAIDFLNYIFILLSAVVLSRHNCAHLWMLSFQAGRSFIGVLYALLDTFWLRGVLLGSLIEYEEYHPAPIFWVYCMHHLFLITFPIKKYAD